MRLIGTFEQQFLARKFSLFLKQEHINHTLDEQIDEKGQLSYSIWVHDEDELEKVNVFFSEFVKDPDNKKFNVSMHEIIDTEIEKTSPPSQTDGEDYEALKRIKPLSVKQTIPFMYKITSILLIICVGIYVLNFYQEHMYKKKNQTITLLTPVQYYLLYDIPHVLIRLNKLIQQYQIDIKKDLKEQPVAFQEDFKRLQEMPYWRGLYEVLVSKWNKTTNAYDFSAPLFEKIRQGQLWRIITPTFLHKDFLHILFNMLWLWFLGKQLERRLSIFRYLFFIFAVGVVTNTLQYLMSGPYFLGYSGVIMGMAGFIWMRQKIAPWEGYPLPKATIIFLLFYIVAMLGIQIFSFFTELFGKSIIMPNIANTAHISGAIMGILLARLSFFAWSPNEH